MPFHFDIRFYEELNDFLPEKYRKRTFSHSCFGRPTIKDIIESLGVPHTEVDLILVNSEPVGFQHKPAEGDMVSVYPVFESLDISEAGLLRDRPLREPRFVADVHLGKLARYMRLMGFDTVYRNDLEDQEIVKLSLEENRVILTRDIQLLKNSSVTHGYFVRSVKPSLQAREVVARFDLASSMKPFIRCIECNGTIEKVDREKVQHLLPAKTRQYYDEFYRCDRCGKVYWKGSHYREMLKWLEGIMNSAGKRG